MNKKQNSPSFLRAHYEITTSANQFREESSRQECSIGKFFSDLVWVVMNNAYIASPADKIDETKLVVIDPMRNLDAMVKESDVNDGNKFKIRETLLPFFQDLKNIVNKWIKQDGFTKEESVTLSLMTTLVLLYENGNFYTHVLCHEIMTKLSDRVVID